MNKLLSSFLILFTLLLGVTFNGEITNFVTSENSKTIELVKEKETVSIPYNFEIIQGVYAQEATETVETTEKKSSVWNSIQELIVGFEDQISAFVNTMADKYPLLATILAILGALVIVAGIVVKITPTKKDDKWWKKAKSMPLVGMLFRLFEAFSPISRKKK